MSPPPSESNAAVVALTQHLLDDADARHDQEEEEEERDTIAYLRARTDSDPPAVLDAAEKSRSSPLDAVLEDELAVDAQFNFESTFRYMTERRLQRRYKGVYKQYSFTAQLVTWIIVIYTLSVLATLAFGAKYETTETTSVTSDSVFYMAVIFFVIYVFVRVALLIRWLLYWAIFASMLGYAITGEVASVFWLSDSEMLTLTQKKLRNVVVVLLIVAEVLTVVVYLFTHRVYPWMVLTGKLNAVKWWDVQRDTFHSNTLAYRSRARRLYTSARNVVTYCGGLDAQQRPHGYGMWTDTSFHGERLTGQWAHGVPIGPFRSFEHGSGYCFVNIRIGYCHNRGETRPDQILFFPKHVSGESNIRWGVGSVECSVSGGFFTFLPHVQHLTPFNSDDDNSGAPQSAADCEPLLRSPTDAVRYVDTQRDDVQSYGQHIQQQQRPPRRVVQKRFASAQRLLFRESSMPSVDLVPQPHGSSTVEKEALVLLHGYNCSLNYGMNRLAQLLALGDFPTEIHPFVFSWPSGGVLAYFQARDIGSESDETARAFHDFLKSLVDAGYTSIHIIAHSMGARIYFACLNKGLLDDVFQPVDGEPEDPGATLRDQQTRQRRRATLATLTFANPDYERHAFVKRGGSYDKSRRLCRCITLYADNMDGALFYSEILTKKTLFGPLNYTLGKRSGMIHRDPHDQEEMYPKKNQEQQNDPEDQNILRFQENQNQNQNQHTHNLAPGEMDVAVALVNQRGHFDGVASFAYNRRLVVGSSSQELEPTGDPSHTKTKTKTKKKNKTTTTAAQAREPDQRLEYLDMDVVDTTWMDNNVHAIRHNYFNLNPTVVEDLRCLVVDRQRAASRPGLLKTNDNVYIFLVAPSHIKNK